MSRAPRQRPRLWPTLRQGGSTWTTLLRRFARGSLIAHTASRALTLTGVAATLAEPPTARGMRPTGPAKDRTDATTDDRKSPATRATALPSVSQCVTCAEAGSRRADLVNGSVLGVAKTGTGWRNRNVGASRTRSRATDAALYGTHSRAQRHVRHARRADLRCRRLSKSKRPASTSKTVVYAGPRS